MRGHMPSQLITFHGFTKSQDTNIKFLLGIKILKIEDHKNPGNIFIGSQIFSS